MAQAIAPTKTLEKDNQKERETRLPLLLANTINLEWLDTASVFIELDAELTVDQLGTTVNNLHPDHIYIGDSHTSLTLTWGK